MKEVIIMKKKKILIIVPIIILIILFVLIILNSKSTNKKLLKDTKSLVTLQSEYEKDFKTNGYKIENLNISFLLF